MPTMIVNSGKDIMVDRLMGGGAEPKYVGWGTGAGSTAVSDTGLFAEASEARVTGTTSKQTITTTNDTHQCVATMLAAAAKTITNVGIFESITAGRMFFKSDFPGVALDVNEGIQFTLRTQFT